MANGPISLSEEQRKKLLREQGKRTGVTGGTGKDEQPNDWVKDLGGALRSGAKNTAKAADAVSDVLVDKDAWRRLMPGGEKATLSDVGNAALDASMLIPGVGLAGGAARVGTRLAAKSLAKEGAKVAERSLSPLAERVVARRGAAAGGNEAIAGAERLGPRLGPRRAEGLPKGPIDKLLSPAKNRLESVAAKKELGEGTKIGLGQARKRVAANALLTGGANLAARAYDESGSRKPAAKTGKGELAPLSPADGGQPYYVIGNELYPLPTDSDGGLQLPASVQRALGDYINKGGSPDGAQVVYLGH